MNKLICSFKDCPASIETPEPVSSVARYTCRQHTGKNPAADLHFQESQFDPQIGSGTDPKFYEVGRGVFGARKQFNQEKSDLGRNSVNAPRKFIDKVIQEACPELDNHENRVEIIEVLKVEIRDHNSGISKPGSKDE